MFLGSQAKEVLDESIAPVTPTIDVDITAQLCIPRGSSHIASSGQRNPTRLSHHTNSVGWLHLRPLTIQFGAEDHIRVTA